MCIKHTLEFSVALADRPGPPDPVPGRSIWLARRRYKRTDADTIACPLCKHEHPSDCLEDWYPEDLVENLKGDDDDYKLQSDDIEPSDRVLRSAKRQAV